jgi:hypothetical protein
MSYIKRVTNKIRSARQSLIRGLREFAEFRVKWISFGMILGIGFFGGLVREGEHT